MRASRSWRRKSCRHGRNRAKRRRRNKQGVFSHDPARKARLARSPCSETFLNLCGTNIQGQLALGNIEDDGVTFRDSRDGAAIGGFGGDVPGHETVRGTGKSSVRKQRDGIAQAGTNQRGSNRQHFPHSWTTFRALIANDDYIPGFDDALLDGGKGRFFVVEYSRGAPEILQIMARDFGHATLRSQIPFQDDEPSSGLKRRMQLADDFLRRRLFGFGCFFGESAASDGDGVSAEQSSV